MFNTSIPFDGKEFNKNTMLISLSCILSTDNLCEAFKMGNTIINKNDYFTLSFYGDRKDIHKVCGSLSGRDVDKTKLTGLTPSETYLL